MFPHFHQANFGTALYLKTSTYILNSLYEINQCNWNNVVKRPKNKSFPNYDYELNWQ